MRSARLLAPLFASILVVGCFQPTSVQCKNGLVCPAGTTCAANQDVCIKTLCGNGRIDTAAGEVCDDGNIVDGDGCSADCTSNESCGNGIVDKSKGEVCDKGADNTSCGGCSADCKSDETCGNGIVDTCKGEVCDDGNNVSGDGCAADCKSTERCGNGVVDVVDGEVCDKGADNNKCTGCSTDCRSNETCGNGIVDACKGEVCDDGNNTPGDGCSSDCKSNETCGNGIVDTIKGEVCDDGNTASGDGCSADCKSEEKCGNGTVDKGEECDPGPDLAETASCGKDCPTESGSCNRDCTVAFCGDNKIDLARNEQCDDGVQTAHCNGNCTLSACGDGIVNVVAGEQCDPGPVVSPGACTPTCTTATDCTTKTCQSDSCTLNCAPVADVANCNGNGAGPAACHTSACGDGYKNVMAGESCDHLGGVDAIDCNGKNAGAVACQTPSCGDGYVNAAAGEECDTKGGADTPTCNGKNAGAASCKVPKCGDGYPNMMAGEACDNMGGSDSNGCNGNSAAAVSAGAACKVPSCGDGYTNTQANETCDTLGGADTASCNGNSAAAKAANVACLSPSCGDNYTNSAAGETCDKGAADTANCNGSSAAAIAKGVACHAAVCGDGYKNAASTTPAGGEQCDSGSMNGDSGSCLSNCKNASCGDGLVQAGVETCDAGSQPGCASCLQPDAGWSCSLPSPPGPSVCAPVCGDGDRITSPASVAEACDDNNVNDCGLCKNGSGCTSADGASVLAAPTPAQGTMASFKNTAYVDGQVFTLSDGAHSVTFEFDNNSVIGAGNVPIDIKNSALQDDMMCRICAAINGSGLNIATGGLGCPAGGCAGNTITLTNNIKGAVGNVKITTTVTSTTFRNGLAGMHLGSGQDCGTAVGCTSNEDCASDVCSLSMTCPGGVPCGACVAASCSDTKQNGLETDLDCGGGTCSGCAATKHCVANTDCASGVCNSTVSSKTGDGTCASPKCNDQVLNGFETDVDCGGTDCTATCPGGASCFQCDAGQGCKVNRDCAPPLVGSGVTVSTTTGVCDAAGSATCVPADIVQVAVTGGGSVSSTSTGTLGTGDITGCTSAAGTCVQSYADGGAVTLTATTTATSGSISWSASSGCTACTVTSMAQSCTCALTLAGNVKVTVTTP